MRKHEIDYPTSLNGNTSLKDRGPSQIAICFANVESILILRDKFKQNSDR